jgi:predicted metal-binding membrane protein
MGEMSMWTRMPGQTWPGFAASFIAMWMTMMIPMMIPPFGVMLWRYRTVATTAGVTRLGVPSVLLGFGYFVVWAAVGVAMLPVMLALSGTSTVATPAFAVMAAIVQLTLRKARLDTTHPEIAAGGRVLPAEFGRFWRDGIRLGIHCAAGCAPLMAILLVIGGTDFRVMAAVTAVITAERLLSSRAVASLPVLLPPSVNG